MEPNVKKDAKTMMDDRTLRILEFDKIKEKLAGLTASALGREKVGELVPETCFLRIKDMMKETDEAASSIIRKGSPPMGGIHDIRAAVKRVEIGAVLGPGELLKVADTLRACRNLKNYAKGYANVEVYEIIDSMINSLEPNKRLEDRIYLCIVNEEEISDAASPALSNIRRQIRESQDSIKGILNGVIRSGKYSKALQESIVTMRGDRYVIPVKSEYRSEIPGLVHDASSSGATIFIEPMAVVEANNNIKQLKIKEQQEIERILGELTGEVASMLDNIKYNIILLGKLDFAFAKGKLSLDLNCVSPRLNENGYILIKKGRHPLIDPKVVVPTDIWLGKDFLTLVITGPNTGGKTVTLKTIGLFTVMCQAGLHIPAGEGTEMAVFGKVFADIGDEQSIEQSLSTFSSHMTNIVRILSRVDDKSLVLFDELGAGTDPTEGAALAMAILEHLYRVKARTAATTHYSELKVYALSTNGVENASCEFNVETLRPTYRLLIGIPGKSNAFAISQRLGLSDGLIERAKEFISQEDIRFEDTISEIELSRRKMEEEKLMAARYRLEIETLKNELEDRRRKLEDQKESVLREARLEARKILQNAKHEAESMLDEMKQLMKEQEEADRKRAMEEARHKLRKEINRLDDALAESAMPKKNSYSKPPKNLRPGDSVVIVNLDQKGTVVTPPGKDGEAIIQAGIMKINVHISNLRLIDEQKSVPVKTGGNKGTAKSRTVSPEIDLRGQTLEEALENVDKYLDDCYLSGLHEAILIHGKGTGALRSGIHQFLRRHTHVKDFRLGKFGEGDAGVTVVEIK